MRASLNSTLHPVRLLRAAVIWLVTLLVIAACTTQETPTAAPVDQPPDATITPAPELAYITPSTPITLENVPAIRLLGRLEAPGPSSTIFKHVFSADGTILATFNNELFMTWDLLTGDLMFRTSRGNNVSLYFSADKSSIYTLDNTGSVDIYDIGQGKQQNSFVGHNDYGGLHAYHVDTGYLTLAGNNGTVKIWDTQERRSMVTLTLSTERVLSLAFSPDARLIAAALRDGSLSIWDWEKREEIASIDPEGEEIARIDFAPDGKRITAGTLSHVSTWDIANSSEIYQIEIAPGGITDIMAHSPDGHYIITGGTTPNALIWDAAAGTMLGQLPDIGGDRTSYAISPDSNLLIASVVDGPVTLWNMSKITDGELTRANINFGQHSIVAVDWSDDGYTLLLFDKLGPIHVWGISDESGS